MTVVDVMLGKFLLKNQGVIWARELDEGMESGFGRGRFGLESKFFTGLFEVECCCREVMVTTVVYSHWQ